MCVWTYIFEQGVNKNNEVHFWPFYGTIKIEKLDTRKILYALKKVFSF